MNREIKLIPVHQIKYDKLPVNSAGLSTVRWLEKGNVNAKPIKVIAHKDGSYRLRDGRHRLLGHKLLGEKLIKAVVSYEKS